MRKFSNNIEDKPLQTDREKVDEIYNAVMNANDVVDRKITFTYLANIDIVSVYRREPYEDCNYRLSDDKDGLQHSKMLRTIQAWQSEKLEQNIEEIYREEKENNAKI